MKLFNSVQDALDQYDDLWKVSNDIWDIYNEHAQWGSNNSKMFFDALDDIAYGIENQIYVVRNRSDWRLVPIDFLYDPAHKTYYLEFIASKGFIDCYVRLYSQQLYFIYPYNKNEKINDEKIEKFKQAKSLLEKLEIYEEEVNN